MEVIGPGGWQIGIFRQITARKFENYATYFPLQQSLNKFAMHLPVTLVNEFDSTDKRVIPRLQVSAAELRALFRFEGQDEDVYLCPTESDGT